LAVLYIVSVEEAAGKTMVCAGLGKALLTDGKTAGYLKPSKESGADGDIAFMKQILGPSNAANAPDVIQGRDVVLVEGMLGASAGDTLSQDTYGAAKKMNAKVIAVETYTSGAPKYGDVYKGFGESLMGFIVNKVPESQMQQVREVVAARSGKAGIKLLGVIPENRVLLTVTVGELAESIQGTILNNAEKSAELVESFMLGAMVVDSGLDYFGRKSNKAAIVRQDRPDMQLAALETSTKCLVLSGSNEPPLYNVSQKAESRGIPIITTETNTSDIVASIEDLLSKTKFRQEQKLTKLAELMKQNLDLSAVV